MKNLLVTGGAGFIGSNLVRYLVEKYPDSHIYNLDKLTYAGNPDNLADIQDRPNYTFIHADIADYPTLREVMDTHRIDAVLNTAAESHVDRSISDPFVFARTNVLGTLSLLQATLEHWEKHGLMERARFFHISTDEVYGALQPGDPAFTETNRYEPHSPYSASKASSDHFVRAYHDTYGLPILISNCSNNYGPYQFPEKLIPLMIHNIRTGTPIPVYGKGENIRDWLYVEDHVRAIDLILHRGRPGQTYNIGGNNEWRNIDLIKTVIRIVDEMLGNPEGHSLPLITFVKDRKGHDLRYAIDAQKIKDELGWEPSVTFEEGIRHTVLWYLDHGEWLERVTGGDYRTYYHTMYHRQHTPLP